MKPGRSRAQSIGGLVLWLCVASMIVLGNPPGFTRQLQLSIDTATHGDARIETGLLFCDSIGLEARVRPRWGMIDYADKERIRRLQLTARSIRWSLHTDDAVPVLDSLGKIPEVTGGGNTEGVRAIVVDWWRWNMGLNIAPRALAVRIDVDRTTLHTDDSDIIDFSVVFRTTVINRLAIATALFPAVAPLCWLAIGLLCRCASFAFRVSRASRSRCRLGKPRQ